MPCYVVRIGQDGGAPAARAELTSAAEPTLGAYRVSALEAGPGGNDITVEVDGRDARAPTDETFKLDVKRNGAEETFDNLTTKKGKQNVVTVVNEQSKLIQLEEIGKAGAAGAAACARQGQARAAARRRLRRASTPTTTSATPPSAPASAASRRSTTSRWSRCPT